MPTYDIEYARKIGEPKETVTRNLPGDDYAAYEYAKVNLQAALIYSIIDVSDAWTKGGRKVNLKPLRERYNQKVDSMKRATEAREIADKAIKAVQEPDPAPEPAKPAKKATAKKAKK